MPRIHPIQAICVGDICSQVSNDSAAVASVQTSVDISTRIAPPYDVLDEKGKRALLDRDEHNIVAIDLPHLPAKTVGPDETYDQAGEKFRQWLDQGILARCDRPALFVYEQRYTAPGDDSSEYRRRGLIANITLQEFGSPPEGSGDRGGVYPHEQTFSGPKEDRLKLMRATRAQLSPIFGLYTDPSNRVGERIAEVADSRVPDFVGNTDNDGVLHQVWIVDDPDEIASLGSSISGADVFIADGHHRYNTALNYRRELRDADAMCASADQCLFVLVALQDPGMIVLPTHRVLGGMDGFSMERFVNGAQGRMKIEPFEGGRDALQNLESHLPNAGPHAMGLFDSAIGKTWVATTVDTDPLSSSHGNHSDAWRQLDVAILQHLIVEGICEPQFCGDGNKVHWKFPHSIEEFVRDAEADGYQLGVMMQPTPLDSVRRISEAGELMPQKSTFFYPKVATGLVINPLE